MEQLSNNSVCDLIAVSTPQACSVTILNIMVTLRFHLMVISHTKQLFDPEHTQQRGRTESLEAKIRWHML